MAMGCLIDKPMLLWLDDYRDPFKDDWLVFSPIGRDCEVVWVKSYDEAVIYLDTHRMPDAVCFDHDLDDEDDNKTGYAVAKYIVDDCITHLIPLPLFASQSANPVGRENILKLMSNAKKFLEDCQ